MLAKSLSFLAGAESAGIVLGARVPIILTSRADTLVGAAGVMRDRLDGGGGAAEAGGGYLAADFASRRAVRSRIWRSSGKHSRYSRSIASSSPL